MTFGSVQRNFTLLHDINGTGYETDLLLIPIYTHIYKLLCAKQSSNDLKHEHIDPKTFICIIEALNSKGFPFMRITHNTELSNNKI